MRPVTHDRNRTAATPAAPSHAPTPRIFPTVRMLLTAATMVLLVAATAAEASTVVRREIGNGLYAHMRNGNQPSLEVHVPSGAAGKELLARVLYTNADQETYASASRVLIPFARLNADTRRTVLLAIFENDYVNEGGWHHIVEFAGSGGKETLWSLAEWLTGRGFNHRAIQSHNNLASATLEKGQYILVPRELLLEEMRKPTPDRTPPLMPVEAIEPPMPTLEVAAGTGPQLARLHDNGGSFDSRQAQSELSYGEDADGPYALYRIKPGEAIYSAVVVRFTNFDTNQAIMEASAIIAERSGITDVTDIDDFTPIKVPVDMLADRFKPPSDPARLQYEASLQESQRLREEIRRDIAFTGDLEGVVVVLDPGHGSRDPGAIQPAHGLYESEIAYDVVCRIIQLLEPTGARVYSTMIVPSRGYTPIDVRRFTHDRSGIVLTTPAYPDSPSQYDSRVSANLRYYISNEIFAKETAAGVDPRRIIFTSIHCDALFNTQHRGAFFYIPGAAARARQGHPDHTNQWPYRNFREVRPVSTTDAERRRDEALSRLFAQTLYDEFGAMQVQRFRHGPAIRTEIRRSRTNVFVPAVLHGNKIPTKVLIEIANMTNPTDRERMADPEWRQRVAQAYVNGLKAHFAAQK